MRPPPEKAGSRLGGHRGEMGAGGAWSWKGLGVLGTQVRSLGSSLTWFLSLSMSTYIQTLDLTSPHLHGPTRPSTALLTWTLQPLPGPRLLPSPFSLLLSQPPG